MHTPRSNASERGIDAETFSRSVFPLIRKGFSEFSARRLTPSLRCAGPDVVLL